MTLSDAVYTRISNRRYLPRPLEPAVRMQLQKTIDQCCRRSGLHIQLVCDRPEPFASFLSTYGMFSGVHSYLVMAGDRGDPHMEEKCGYYGEEIVLTATAMGLGTCWVGGTFKKRSCSCHLKKSEKLVCVITIGYAPAEDRPDPLRRTLHRRSKSVAALSAGLEQAPDWFARGMEAVQRAPSAVNRQGVLFTWQNDTVTARRSVPGPFSLVDLGIAKYHFQLGAHGGRWGWGDKGRFEKAREEKSCGAVIWRESPRGREYLLAQHRGGHWSFPKGHVEDGESEADTALREIREETGLIAQLDQSFRQVVTYYPKSDVIKDVIFFLATVTGGRELAQEAEIAELGWFSFPDARALVTYASDEEVLLAAEAYLAGA